MKQPGQKAGLLEWVLRIAIITGIVYGGSLLVNAVLPTVNTALDLIENSLLKTLAIAAIATPIAFVVGYVLLNPMFVWMSYLGIVRKITSFFIKMDPLSYMDSYADLIESKLRKLRDIVIVSLLGKQKSLQRLINEAKDTATKEAKLGLAAREIGNKNQMALHGNAVANAKSTVDTFTPLLNSLNQKIDFLQKLAENWDYSAQQLRQTIDVKRREYQVLSTTVAGLKEAESWINSDNEAARVYAESVKALEENVTQKLGYIDQFESNSKGLMETMALEKEVRTTDGIAALDAFDENQQFFLPTDWNNTVDLPQADYAVVDVKKNSDRKFGNLLKLDQ